MVITGNFISFKNSKVHILILFLFSMASAASAINIDSLKAVVRQLPNDTTKVNTLIILADEVRKTDAGLSMEYGNEALKMLDDAALQSKVGANWTKKNKSFLLNIIGIIYWQKGDNEKAIQHYVQSLRLSEELIKSGQKDANGEKCRSLNNIGIVYANMKNFDKGIEYFKKALEIKISIGAEQKSVANSYNNIGNLYYEKKILDSAETYFNKALKIRDQLGDKRGIASSHTNIGQLEEERKNYEIALVHYDLAQKEASEINEKRILNNILRAKGKILIRFNRLEEAIELLNQSLAIAIEQQAKPDIFNCYEALTSAYEKKGDYAGALQFHKLYVAYKDSVFNETNNKVIEELNTKYETEKKEQEIQLLNKDKVIQDADIKRQQQISLIALVVVVLVSILSLFLIKSNRARKKANAILTQQKIEIENANRELEKLSIVASETTNAVTIADAEGNVMWTNRGFERLHGYSFEKLINERGRSVFQASTNPNIKDLVTDAITKRESVSYISANFNPNGTVWVQTTLTPIFKGDALDKLVLIDSDISLLKKAETEISIQRDLLEKRNERITESINYAKRIQHSVLPPLSTIRSHFKNSFLFFQPKDIVSGDMYWLHENGDEVLFSVIDCTGHGVPGAFMTIFAYNLLDVIVNQFSITKPSAIVSSLSIRLEEFQKNSEVEDGMELMLCNYNKKTGLLQFSGAFSSMYLIRNKELTEYKGDLIPIGNTRLSENTYTNHELNMQPGDSLYLFTDGYADQRGGPGNKKFYYKPFRDLLSGSDSMNPDGQLALISNTINDWKNGKEQIDDMCILGIHF